MVGDVDEQTGLPTEHTEDTEDTEDTEENGDSATQRSKVLFSSVRFQPQKLNRRQQRERRVVHFLIGATDRSDKAPSAAGASIIRFGDYPC